MLIYTKRKHIDIKSYRYIISTRRKPIIEIKLKNKTYPFPLFLAPLAGYSDAPFRGLCRRMGADLAVTEMVSSYSIHYSRNKKKNNFEILLKKYRSESPFYVQLFGNDPAMLAEAAIYTEAKGADIIDLNLGCPVKKIIKQNAGSALLGDPLQIKKIVSAMKKAVRIPLSAKIRLGIRKEKPNYMEVAKALEGEGIDFLTVHGRFQEQMFKGTADLDAIHEIASSLAIPVIGNGDVVDIPSYNSMKETGCSGIMIGRGAVGNPWIFSLLKKFEKNSKAQEFDYTVPAGLQKIITRTVRKHVTLPRRSPGIIKRNGLNIGKHDYCCTVLYHLISLADFYGEVKGVREFRKHLGKYVKGMPNTHGLKNDIFRELSLKKNLKLIMKYLTEDL
ncbi:tRNA dihydrouridine synthase [Spirochaetota bacterium]